MKAIRTVRIRNDKVVSLGVFVNAIKTAKANPEIEFKHGLGGWWPEKGWKIVRDFRKGMHDRISSNIGRSQVWPTWKWFNFEYHRKDRKGTAARLLAYRRKHGRECGWCGSRIQVGTLADQFCDVSCARAYRGY